MRVLTFSLSVLLFWHPIQVQCKPIKIDIPESWQLDKVGAKIEDLGHAIVDFAHHTGEDLEKWRQEIDELLKKEIKALDEWAEPTLGLEVDGFFQGFAEGVQTKLELVHQALSGSRSLCYTSKLDVLSSDLTRLSQSLPDPNLVLQVQAFQKVIENRRDPTVATLSTHFGAWEGYINETSEHLDRGWTDLQTVLRPAVDKVQASELTRITNYISSGFASTWGEIAVFASTHHFNVVKVETFIKDHPIIFAIFAGLLITGGLALMIGPQMILAILHIVGFSQLGPVAGSLAATWQSVSYGGLIPKGSIFSLLQSFAMGGITSPSGAQVLLGGVLVATGGTIIYVLLDGKIEMAHDDAWQDDTATHELD